MTVWCQAGQNVAMIVVTLESFCYGTVLNIENAFAFLLQSLENEENQDHLGIAGV